VAFDGRGLAQALSRSSSDVSLALSMIRLDRGGGLPGDAERDRIGKIAFRFFFGAGVA
jgi:hypothetical protein